jgi:hypothetical protein
MPKVRMLEPKPGQRCEICNSRKAIIVFKHKALCEICIYPDEEKYLKETDMLIRYGKAFDGNINCGDVTGINYRRLFDGVKGKK